MTELPTFTPELWSGAIRQALVLSGPIGYAAARRLTRRERIQRRLTRPFRRFGWAFGEALAVFRTEWRDW